MELLFIPNVKRYILDFFIWLISTLNTEFWEFHKNTIYTYSVRCIFMANLYCLFSEGIDPFPIPLLIFNEIYINLQKSNFQIYSKRGRALLLYI